MNDTVIETSAKYGGSVVSFRIVNRDVTVEMTPLQAITVANSLLRGVLMLQTNLSTDLPLKRASDLLHEALGGVK